jgi:hypothetical protein
MKLIRLSSILWGSSALLAFAVLTPACSSGSNGSNGGSGSNVKTSSKPASKGAGAKTAADAKKNGQKVGKTAKANESKASDKGATMGGANKTKGGEAKSPEAAQKAGEKIADDSKVKADVGQAEDKGADYEQAKCDDTFESTGFCGDDTHAFFCTGGHWYALDCSTAENGAFCGEDLDAHSLDCYAVDDFEQDGEAVTCDDSDEGTAWCADDSHAVFCDGGHWYSLSCGDVLEGSNCEEAEDISAIDCVQDGMLIEEDG